jgi:hypothetical protein
MKIGERGGTIRQRAKDFKRNYHTRVGNAQEYQTGKEKQELQEG